MISFSEMARIDATRNLERGVHEIHKLLFDPRSINRRCVRGIVLFTVLGSRELISGNENNCSVVDGRVCRHGTRRSTLVSMVGAPHKKRGRTLLRRFGGFVSSTGTSGGGQTGCGLFGTGPVFSFIGACLGRRRRERCVTGHGRLVGGVSGGFTGLPSICGRFRLGSRVTRVGPSDGLALGRCTGFVSGIHRMGGGIRNICSGLNSTGVRRR